MLAFLQFDASSIPLLERLLAEGRLPALADLRRRGTWTSLGRPTPLFVEAGSYVTLYSGNAVADHGIYSAFQWSPADQRVRFMDAYPPPPAVWDRLAQVGCRSLVIDPYESWPPTETRGLRMLNGWQFKHKLLLRIGKPPGAQAALSLRLGRPPSIEQTYGSQSAADLLGLRSRLLAAPGRGAAAIERLTRTKAFDLVWITFSAAHFAGHFYWDLSDAPGIEQLAPHERRELEATLDDAYAAVDAAIGRAVQALPDDADIVVFSPIGMGPDSSRSDLLPDMLRAVLGERRPADATGRADQSGSAIWRLRSRVPVRWRRAAARPLPGIAVRDLTARLQLRGTDWSRTSAFTLPGDHAGYIRFNLRGRERDGILDPADADALADEIAAGLATFRDPDGAPSVAAVHRVTDAVEGERIEQLPDLVVEWSVRPTAKLTGVSSSEFGDVARRGVGTGRTGNHNTAAWALVVPGRSRARSGREPELRDLAATACALTGADASGIGGESLFEPA